MPKVLLVNLSMKLIENDSLKSNVKSIGFLINCYTKWNNCIDSVKSLRKIINYEIDNQKVKFNSEIIWQYHTWKNF